ncbi:MAG: thioredoxin-like domain-containing protein [Bacteroidales bacterium]|nr:thioredoxin-like domain-containing protein [Bacteroidales bacterium]
MWKKLLKKKQIESKHQYISIFIINVVLLLVLILVGDIQVLMYFGGWLFFQTSLLFSKIISTRSLIGLFLLLSFPFLIVGFLFTSFKYHHSISLESLSLSYLAFIYFLISFLVGFLFGCLLQKMIKQPTILISFSVSISCLVFASIAGYYGWAHQFVFTGLIYFIGGLFNDGKSFRQIMTFYFILVLPISLTLGPVFIINGLTHVYPIIVIPLISSFVGIWFKHQIRGTNFKHALIIGTIFLIILGMGYWGMKNYLQFIFGLDDEPYITELKFDFYNESDSSFDNIDIVGKTTVIYFHTKSCKVCYEKLPELESLYSDFKHDTNIIIIAAFIPYQKTTDTSFIFKYHRKKGFSFPQYQTREVSKEYEHRFNIKGYPHVTIINKQGQIIHNGHFNNDPMVFIDNAKHFVQSDK